MNCPSESEPAEATHEQLRSLLLDDHLAALRQGYSTTMLAILVNLADWLAVDAWLGGGKVTDPGEPQPDESSYPSFRAISMVLCMAAELTESAVTMAATRRYYAVGAAVRQLIECEYLLALFNQDLDHASTWIHSTPAEIRATFSPAKMRKRTGAFSHQEYWSHSDTGGHPAPKGARLLEKFDPAREVWPYAAAELTIDLGLHLRRIWRATDEVLAQHHARYTQVRANQRGRAEEAWADWREADPLVNLLPTLQARRD